MHYVYATLKKNMEFYVFFSTLAEFDKWNSQQRDEWKPLEIYMGDFKKIRKQNPIIINPLSDMLILTGEQVDDMKIVQKKAENNEDIKSEKKNNSKGNKGDYGKRKENNRKNATEEK